MHSKQIPMTNDQFFTLLSKTHTKNIRIGIFILLFGLITVIGAVAFGGADFGNFGKIFMLALGGLCILLGIFMPLKAINAGKDLKAGKHPLAKAILENDKNYVLWFHEQVYTVENVKQTAAHQIWIYNRNNKADTISVKRNDTNDVMNFLAEKFPDALMGYSEEFKKKYNQMVKK